MPGVINRLLLKFTVAEQRWLLLLRAAVSFAVGIAVFFFPATAEWSLAIAALAALLLLPVPSKKPGIRLLWRITELSLWGVLICYLRPVVAAIGAVVWGMGMAVGVLLRAWKMKKFSWRFWLNCTGGVVEMAALLWLAWRTIRTPLGDLLPLFGMALIGCALFECAEALDKGPKQGGR